MILRILLGTYLIQVCISKKYVLLPYDSDLCKNNSQGVHKYYEFTINQQINLNTDDNIANVLSIMKLSSFTRFQMDSENYKYYLCRILVKPMGRPMEHHGLQGYYSFWNVRIRIDRISNIKNCNDYLLFQFRNQDSQITTLEGYSDEILNVTCNDSLPIVVPSPQRKVYITYFSSNPSLRSGYVINVTTFIYYKGDFTPKYQEDMCRRQDGFWCAPDNSTASASSPVACIFRDMKCDGYDSCFDGGTDEADCAIFFGNYSVVTVRPRSASSGVIDYLPWLAVGVLPLILLLALICICSQHRSEVYLDEEEDGLEVDKSHDEDGGGDDMWSSAECLDKVEGDVLAEDQNDASGGQWMAKERSSAVSPGGYIGLMPLAHQDTTKADMAISPTLQSINREYEDIDEPGDLPCVKTGLCSSQVHGDREASEHRQNIMSISQMTDDDYEDHLEDVGSLLRKVDKSKIPEEVRITGNRSSISSIGTVVPIGPVTQPVASSPPVQSSADNIVDYRSDYILV